LKLKQSEIKAYRDRQLLAQDHICPLCGHLITPDNCALDHDHSTGHVRQVLHKICNWSLGKVEKAAGRVRDSDLFLDNVVDYIRQDWSMNPLHPLAKIKTQPVRLRSVRTLSANTM